MSPLPQSGHTARYVDPPTHPGLPVPGVGPFPGSEDATGPIPVVPRSRDWHETGPSWPDGAATTVVRRDRAGAGTGYGGEHSPAAAPYGHDVPPPRGGPAPRSPYDAPGAPYADPAFRDDHPDHDHLGEDDAGHVRFDDDGLDPYLDPDDLDPHDLDPDDLDPRDVDDALLHPQPAVGPGDGRADALGDPRLTHVPAAVDLDPRPRRGRVLALLVPVAVGIAVSVGIGVFARAHQGTGVALNLAGFSSGIAAKAWLTAAAFVLGLVQLGSALVLSGRLGGGAGRRTHLVHRWSGRAAVLLTVPVAVHCLYALGFSDSGLRVLLHSLFGCFFYGAFAAKMLVLTRRGTPGWALPVFGGLVFTLLTALFLTSSVWFFASHGVTF